MIVAFLHVHTVHGRAVRVLHNYAMRRVAQYWGSGCPRVGRGRVSKRVDIREMCARCAAAEKFTRPNSNTDIQHNILHQLLCESRNRTTEAMAFLLQPYTREHQLHTTPIEKAHPLWQATHPLPNVVLYCLANARIRHVVNSSNGCGVHVSAVYTIVDFKLGRESMRCALLLHKPPTQTTNG